MLLFFNSCITTGLISDLQANVKFPKSVFDDGKEIHIFKTSIDLYKNHFSGMLIVKKNDKKTYRTVFVNEIGMKFFDFTVSDKEFTVNYIFDALNRKLLLKLFASDFRLMLMNDVSYSKSKIYYSQDKKNVVFKIKKRMYFATTADNKLTKIEQYSTFRKTLQIDYKNYTNNFPKNIILNHRNIKFSMELELIKSN